MENSPQSVVENVVQSVATSANTDPVELPLLYEVVDPDALDTIVHRMSDGEVCFQYAGHTVTVQSEGTVTVVDESKSQPKRATPTTDD